MVAGARRELAKRPRKQGGKGGGPPGLAPPGRRWGRSGPALGHTEPAPGNDERFPYLALLESWNDSGSVGAAGRRMAAAPAGRCSVCDGQLLYLV